MVLDADGIGSNVMNNNTVGWKDKFCMDVAFEPSLVPSYVASAVVLVNIILLIRQKATRAPKRGRASQGNKIP